MRTSYSSRRQMMLGVVAIAIAAGCAEQGEFARLGRGVEDVVLTNSAGAQVRWNELEGRPRALFFGFTHCPVICPVTVYELTAALDKIGAPPGSIEIQFITVDPERDTSERMATYFSGFGPRVVGYTGEASVLERLTRSFEVTVRRVDQEGGGYTMDHTATVFLLNGAGRVVDVIAYGTPPEVIEQRLQALLRE